MFTGVFFKLIFCDEIMRKICEFTNVYADKMKDTKKYMHTNWKDLTIQELYTFFALLMYMSIMQAPAVEHYWSTKVLFHGLWARAFMSKFRFKQIQCFLKVSDINKEIKSDKLSKVRFMHEFVRRKCMKFWQPLENISVDERMVQNKGRYAFRQFMKDKPTKWGMKIWVLADSSNGYTYNYEVYTGRVVDQENKSQNGLAYDVVMGLCKSVFGQGYRLFMDNYYTSIKLFLALLQKKIVACGTILLNRKDIPVNFKNTKEFNKNSHRGSMRWIRIGNLGLIQWKDNKIVTVLTSIHKNLSERFFCSRRVKIHNEFRKMEVRQPGVVRDYNTHMGGVDRSDQLIGNYTVLRKTAKFWKTLMYHF